MKKINWLNPLKALALFAVAFAVLFTTSCDGDDDDDDDASQTLAEIIEENAELSEFAAFIEANAELSAIVSGTENHTVFAPNDDAFDKLRETLGQEDLSKINTAIITQVLRFHFSTEVRSSSGFSDPLPTIQGESIAFQGTGGNPSTGGSDQDVEVLSKDVEATNGILHIVETILIPPTVFGEIGTNLGTLAQPILLGSDFTDVAAILAVADNGVAEGDQIKTLLKNRDTTITLFLPTNQVFAGVAASLDPPITEEQLVASFTASGTTARGFLLNSITNQGAYDAASDFTAQATFTMLSQNTYAVATTTVSAQVPLGFVLVNAADTDKQSPVFALNVFQATLPDPLNEGEFLHLETAQNGVLNVSAPLQ